MTNFSMTDTLKSNDNFAGAEINLPLPPERSSAVQEMEIYARFMRHLRMVPHGDDEVKILSAIQFTADMLDIGDALITKTLVDLGLRSPRSALPEAYLEFIDGTLLRSGWHVGGPSESAAELKLHWDEIGEDKFASYRRNMVLPEATLHGEL